MVVIPSKTIFFSVVRYLNNIKTFKEMQCSVKKAIVLTNHGIRYKTFVQKIRDTFVTEDSKFQFIFFLLNSGQRC